MSARQYRSTVEAKTLSAGINSSVTSITLNSVTTLPSTYPYTLVIDPDTATEEIVTVTANAGGTTLTVVRGQDGTSGQEHNPAAVVKHMITARDLQDAQNHIEASTGGYTIVSDGTGTTQSLHGIASGEGAVVGTLKEQTLTLKTLTSPTINTATITSPTISNPTISGTITGAVVTSANIIDGTIVNADINASAAIDWTKLAISSTVSATELGYVDGVTSAIQTQLDGKVTTPGAWSSWTPTLGNLTLGSGSTATYKYNQVGKTVNFSIDITFAGTSSGSSGSLITFTLPVTASGNYKGVFASGGYATASGSSPFTIFGLLSSGSTTVMRLNYPVTGSFGAGLVYGTFGLSSITAGAYLQIAGTYEAA
jgi:hypothetical protein